LIVQKLTIRNSGKVRGLELWRDIIDFESLKLRSCHLKFVNVKKTGVADYRELDEFPCVNVRIYCDRVDSSGVLNKAAADNKA
jgi:hypothetical protein